MTFVHGPEGVAFSEDKPAKLRFFLGCVDDLAVAEDGVDKVTFPFAPLYQCVFCYFRLSLCFVEYPKIRTLLNNNKFRDNSG